MERKRIIIYALLIAVFMGVVFLPGFSELQKLRENTDQYQKRIFLLEQHNDKLKEELRKMVQDPAYVEKKARNKLGVVKKGEIIYKKSSSGE